MEVIEGLKKHMENICDISMTLDMSDYTGYCKFELTQDAIARLAEASRPRADYVQDNLSKLGYNPVSIDIEYKNTTGKNVFAANGKGPFTFFICHHDYWAGKGADDNGSGMAIILELAKQLQGKENIAFASFDFEECGLQGSYNFSKHYDNTNIANLICLDSVASAPRVIYCNAILNKDHDGIYPLVNTEASPGLINELKQAKKDVAYDMESGYLMGFNMDLMSFTKDVAKTGIISVHPEGKYIDQLMKGKPSGNLHTQNDVLENVIYDNLEGVTKTLLTYMNNRDISKKAA